MDDLKYLTTFMYRMAGDGISIPRLEDPSDWVMRKWRELGGDPEAEFSEAEFVELLTRPTPTDEGKA